MTNFLLLDQLRSGSSASTLITASLERTRTQDGRMQHLDGLRAIALCGVLLFHFGGLLSGGFLGVDVFFVLSGFLMTRAVWTQVAHGTFSLRKFLTSRILRICPALFTTILLTLVVVVYTMPKPAIPPACKSASTASLFFSNVQFMAENGYHDAESTTKPLLHTWSLAVEGQFYILWSLLALVGSLDLVVASMAVLSIASIAHVILSRTNSAGVFFLMPNRLYQFSAGSLSILLYDRAPGFLELPLNVLGLILIFGSFFVIQAHHAPISLASLPAVIGAMLVIACPSGCISGPRGLAHPFLRYIGNISYSAYLVHWPIIVMCLSMLPVKKNALVLASVLTLLCTPMLYYMVEERFRLTKEKSRVRDGVYFCALLIVSIQVYSFSISFGAREVISQTADHARMAGSSFVLQTADAYRDAQAALRDEMLLPGQPLLSGIPREPYTAVYGDSYSKHLLPALNVSGHSATNPKRFVFHWKPGCLTLPANQSMIPPSPQKDREKAVKACLESGQNLDRLLSSSRPEMVIYAGRWQDYLHDRWSMARLSVAINATLNYTDSLGIMGLSPRPPVNILDCLWRRTISHKVAADANETCPHEYIVPRKYMDDDKTLQNFFKQFPRTTYFSAISSNCCRKDNTGDAYICAAWDPQEGPYYYDNAGHLTNSGAEKLTSNLLKYLLELPDKSTQNSRQDTVRIRQAKLF